MFELTKGRVPGTDEAVTSSEPTVPATKKRPIHCASAARAGERASFADTRKWPVLVSRALHMGRCGFFVVLAAAPVLAIAGQARAQSAAEKQRAQELQKDGMRLLEKGDSRGALKDFDEAIRLFPSPKILFNMGLAHKALGQEVDAVNDFERFLDEAPYAPKQSREMAQKIVSEIRPRLSYLDIATDDVGSHITVDGRDVGVAPLPRPLAVSPGAHEVRLTKADMRPASRSVSPVPGQKLRVFVQLLPVAASPPVAATPARPPVESEPHPLHPPPPKDDLVAPTHLREADDTPPPPAGAGPGRRALKWVAWGAALAGAGVGVYGTLHNSALVDDFDKGCGLANGMAIADSTGQKTQTQCGNLKAQYESAARLGLIGFVAAGALAAGGFIFWATEPSVSTGPVASASCVPAVSATLEPSVFCALRF